VTPGVILADAKEVRMSRAKRSEILGKQMRRLVKEWTRSGVIRVLRERC